MIRYHLGGTDKYISRDILVLEAAKEVFCEVALFSISFQSDSELYSYLIEFVDEEEDNKSNGFAVRVDEIFHWLDVTQKRYSPN